MATRNEYTHAVGLLGKQVSSGSTALATVKEYVATVEADLTAAEIVINDVAAVIVGTLSNVNKLRAIDALVNSDR